MQRTLALSLLTVAATTALSACGSSVEGEASSVATSTTTPSTVSESRPPTPSAEPEKVDTGNLVERLSAAFGGVPITDAEAEQVADGVCSQFSELGSSREEVVANVARTEGLSSDFAGEIVDIAVDTTCPQ
ncbi:DUF732 domain-containing protein [Rhodococcoides kroppenstedtii]|uniref:DUF732 domain-containing protein n=1 Tax=Rhodococcoides kroppenstedtii TaxID=293050 RepID=UPI0009F44358